MKQLIAWQQVRAGDRLQKDADANPVDIDWVAHDYDIANPGRLLVVFKGTFGIGIIAANEEVWKIGHDFERGMRQRVPFQGLDAAFADTDNARSWRLYQQADAKWQSVSKYITGFMHAPASLDVELQWFYEEVLTPEERAAWDIFVPGGSATAEQLTSVKFL